MLINCTKFHFSELFSLSSVVGTNLDDCIFDEAQRCSRYYSQTFGFNFYAPTSLSREDRVKFSSFSLLSGFARVSPRFSKNISSRNAGVM